jgi:REP element-mobilizing transposase RayT
VHLVASIHSDRSLSSVVHSWKSYSAHRIRRVANVAGRVWQPEYWDRFIRDDNHFVAAVEYVEANPVNAGLVMDAEAWPFSSATRA